MASPPFIGAGAATSINGSDGPDPIPVPAGVAAGDLMVLVIEQNLSTGDPSPPAGWTLLVQVDPNNQFLSAYHAYWKIAGASEPATYDVGVTGQFAGSAVIAAWRGADQTTPINVSTTQQNSTSSTNVGLPSLTTTVADTTLVHFYGEFGGAFPTATFTPDAAMTERLDTKVTGRPPYSIADQAIAAAGATGTRTATASSSMKTAVLSFAIAPAAAVVATTYTLEGPSSGTVGVASSNFTVTPDAAVSADVVVTPSDGGDGGTFSPTSVTFASGTSTAQTFTYTPASAGVKTISTTNDGSLTDPSSLSFTASAASGVTIPVFMHHYRQQGIS